MKLCQIVLVFVVFSLLGLVQPFGIVNVPCRGEEVLSKTLIKAAEKDDGTPLVEAETSSETPKAASPKEDTAPNIDRLPFAVQEKRDGFDPVAEIIKLAESELVQSVWTAANEIARDLFALARRETATVLTASLPEDERIELLERTLGPERVQSRRKAKEEAARTLSVQEAQVAAAVKEARRKTDMEWQEEKESIYQQAEQAAKERLETELSIQKQRMEQEQQKLVDEAEALRKEVENEKVAVNQLKEAAEKQKQLADEELADRERDEKNTSDEQQKRLLELEKQLQLKEDQMQQDQQRLTEISKKLESAEKKLLKDAPLKEEAQETPRIHAGRYTPSEYRALTEEEKAQVKALRVELGVSGNNNNNNNNNTATIAPVDNDAKDAHPVLGLVIEDLGYKRIHLMSAGKLGTIPIWEKQRIYRHDRTKAMVKDKWKSMELGLPGIICLHEDADGKLAIIDGQHRVGMMMLLQDKQRKQEEEEGDKKTDFIDFDRVLVEVYPAVADANSNNNKQNHAQDLFLEINKAEPIKLVDMPGVAKAKDRNVITDAVDGLYDLYPEMFSPSQKCRSPNVNVDNLRNALFGAEVMPRHKLTTSKKLIDWVLKQNAELASKYSDDNDEDEYDEQQFITTVSPKALKKAKRYGFYLGIDSTWLYK